MPSDLFNTLGKKQPSRQAQSPRDAAMTLLKQQGIDIPKGMENNPQALIQHVMHSGKVPNNRLSMAQQMMQKMFSKR